MQSQNVVSMPRPHPPLIDRLRVTLQEVDEGLAANPNHTAAREFRRFLIGAISDLESKQFDTAA